MMFDNKNGKMCIDIIMEKHSFKKIFFRYDKTFKYCEIGLYGLQDGRFRYRVDNYKISRRRGNEWLAWEPFTMNSWYNHVALRVLWLNYLRAIQVNLMERWDSLWSIEIHFGVEKTHSGYTPRGLNRSARTGEVTVAVLAWCHRLNNHRLAHH